MSAQNPEIGKSIDVGGIATNYHDMGQGETVLFIHGSGPGVSAWANWRLNLPVLSQSMRCVAPDMVGFGYTYAPDDFDFSMPNWVGHLKGFADALGLERFSVVGNSFGGALALAFAIAYPDKVKNLVLMGSVGVPFAITPGLDAVWGYTPSLEGMKHLLDLFAFNRGLINDDLAQMRYEASLREGSMQAWARMFPAPRQRHVDAMASPADRIAALKMPTLILHGQEDQVIPVANAHDLFALLPHAELHLFRGCGHWTQIEKKDRFNALVAAFVGA